MAKRENAERDELVFGKRILILVAHPDDEVVACCASLGRAREAGATISALYLTDGCLSEATVWPWQRKGHPNAVGTRRREAVEVAKLLGINSHGFSNRAARHLWRDLRSVSNEVEAAVRQIHPDQIWVPAYEGGNPDHDALNAVGSKFTHRMSILEFSEYNYFEGKVRSNDFISSQEPLHRFELTLGELVLKQKALKIYASEKGNLSSLTCDFEAYRPLARYDYSRPPHQGQLWYTRYQWVPFRHPRVDFTTSEEVSNAITSFLSGPRVL